MFGVIYAQAEDDFNRVETNYLNSMGRLAEAEGEAEIYRDLRMKLFIDPADMKAQYAEEPGVAEDADERLGRRPELLPLQASAGEAARDHALRAVDGADLQRRQHRRRHREGQPERSSRRSTARRRRRSRGARADEPTIAIRRADRIERHRRSRRRTPRSHHALLLINPHTSFFFRSEAQMVSDEGLNAYGALTWGQFFIYQGFNERAGWMHTSSGVDNIDEYLETVTKKGDGFTYRYGTEERPVTVEQDHRAVQDRRPAWRRRSSPSTARTTGRSSARPTASG